MIKLPVEKEITEADGDAFTGRVPVSVYMKENMIRVLMYLEKTFILFVSLFLFYMLHNRIFVRKHTGYCENDKPVCGIFLAYKRSIIDFYRV
jgi:hypothetical protein